MESNDATAEKTAVNNGQGYNSSLDDRLNQARMISGNTLNQSTNAAANTATTNPGFAFNNSGNAYLPVLRQQPGGFGGISSQVFNQQAPGFNPLMMNSLVGRPQNNMDQFYLQQLFAMQSGNHILAQPQNNTASLGHLNIPMDPRNPLDTSSSQRAPPNALELQNALATIAAARTGTNNGPVPAAAKAEPTTEPENTNNTNSTGGRSPVLVYMECDEESLSDYQCLLRKQIELFEATVDDVQWNAQGRNKAIILGQVGLRCRHCARLATWARARGAVYYSATLDGLYQAGQNMAKNHLCKHCRLIPGEIKNELLGLRDFKRRAAGGKNYWAEGARVLGVYQSDDGLRFKNSTTGMEGSKSEKE